MIEYKVKITRSYQSGKRRCQVSKAVAGVIDDFFKSQGIPLTHKDTVRSLKIEGSNMLFTTGIGYDFYWDLVGKDYIEAFHSYLNQSNIIIQ